jgi:hypothetical protein
MRMNTAFSAALLGLASMTSCVAPIKAVKRTPQMELQNFEEGKKNGTIIGGVVAVDSVSQSGAILFSDNRIITMNRTEQEEAATVLNDGNPNNDNVTLGPKELFPSSTVKGKTFFFSRGRPYVE